MQIMCIRKGKRLVARIIPFLSPEQAADLLLATARNLPFLIKKDAQDEASPAAQAPAAPLGRTGLVVGQPLIPAPRFSPQVLPCLLRPFSHVLYHLPLGTVTSLVQQLTNLPQSAAAPAATNLHLATVLQNKVGARGAGIAPPCPGGSATPHLRVPAVRPVPAVPGPEPRGGAAEHGRRHGADAGQPVVRAGAAGPSAEGRGRAVAAAAHTPSARRTELMLLAARELLRVPPAALPKPVPPPSNLLSLFSRYVDQQKLNLLQTKLQ